MTMVVPSTQPSLRTSSDRALEWKYEGWTACRGAQVPEPGASANPIAASQRLAPELNPPRPQRLGNALQPRGNVDAIAKDIVVVDDDVADVNAYAKFDPYILRHVSILLGHPPRDFDRTAGGIDGAGEFHKHTSARSLDDAATMVGHGGITERFSGGLQPGQRAFLVGPHETAITGDIRRQNRCQSPFNALDRHGCPKVPILDLSKHA